MWWRNVVSKDCSNEWYVRDKDAVDRVPFTYLANYIMVLVWRELYILYILYIIFTVV